MVFLTAFGNILHFAVQAAPVFKKKKRRSKEALEEPFQCKMCSLTKARSKIIKMHSFTVDTQNAVFDNKSSTKTQSVFAT